MLTRVGALGVVLGGVALGVWWYLTANQATRLALELQQLQAEMSARLAERDAMIARLSREERVGVLEVGEQRVDDRGTVLDTHVTFIEVDDLGRELGRTSATVPGDTIFVDAWTARFDTERVAEGHPFMGRTVILLRRIFSDRMSPRDGVPIDTPGAIPDGYAASDAANFEKRLWESFWQIATDADLSRQFGVRVAQGEAVYKPVRTGQRYELTVQANGGMSLVPLG